MNVTSGSIVRLPSLVAQGTTPTELIWMLRYWVKKVQSRWDFGLIDDFSMDYIAFNFENGFNQAG